MPVQSFSGFGRKKIETERIMARFLWICLGGAIGTGARYLLSGWLLRVAGPGFPYGTLAVNVAGSLIMGVLIELSALVWSPSPELRALLTVGVLGGYTTFSTFSLDVAFLMQRGDTAAAAIYVVVSVLLSVGALFAGLHIIRGMVG